MTATRPLRPTFRQSKFDRGSNVLVRVHVYRRRRMKSRLPPQARRLLLTITQIEHIHRVSDPDVVARLAELHLQLQRTASVTGDHRFSVRFEDVLQLTAAEIRSAWL